jgi:hypothetical protein
VALVWLVILGAIAVQTFSESGWIKATAVVVAGFSLLLLSFGYLRISIELVTQ